MWWAENETLIHSTYRIYCSAPYAVGDPHRLSYKIKLNAITVSTTAFSGTSPLYSDLHILFLNKFKIYSKIILVNYTQQVLYIYNDFSVILLIYRILIIKICKIMLYLKPKIHRVCKMKLEVQYSTTIRMKGYNSESDRIPENQYLTCHLTSQVVRVILSFIY